MKLSWDMLNRCEKQYGSAFFLIDLNRFHMNYTEFLTAFQRGYPNSTVAYSYKTNYLPALCRLINEWGGLAEVVSPMELEVARRVGVAPENILFNGPGKDAATLEDALLAGTVVNLDSQHETECACAVGRRHPDARLHVGLRCNFQLHGEASSRFGLQAENGDLGKAAALVRNVPSLELVGLHCHRASSTRSPESYARRARAMIRLTRECFPDQAPAFVDIGGGFFSQMTPELRQQFKSQVPTFQDYANAVAPLFAKAFGSSSTAPRLILEPGVALTADIMRFVTRVLDVKQLHDRSVAVVAGSVFDVQPTRKAGINLPVQVIQKDPTATGTRPGPVDFVGWTCMESDCLHTHFPGPVAVGDYLAVDNVGAYSIVLKPPFIRPSPPIIGIGTEPERLLRRGETFADVFATYNFDS